MSLVKFVLFITFSWTHFSKCYVVMSTSAKELRGFHEVDFVTSGKLKTSLFNKVSSPIRQSLRNRIRLQVISLKSLSSVLKSIFLPSGYPESVPPEYTQFQIWNLIQDLCSYLRGIMATRAILEGLGVGRADMTSVQATLNWVIRDGASMFGGLVFTAFSSANFGQNSKSWRLFADYINNIGITIDLVAPLSRKYFVHLICLSSICKALCGVAAGASNAVISEHWGSKSGNIAEVNSKNGAQHTAVSLLGLMLSIPFTKFASKLPTTTWTVYSILTLIHMVSNYRAVRCLRLRSINLDRVVILMKSYINIFFELLLQQHQQQKLIATKPHIELKDMSLSTTSSNSSNNSNNNWLNNEILNKLKEKNYLFSLQYVASVEPILSLLIPNIRENNKLSTRFCQTPIKLWVSPSQLVDTLSNANTNTSKLEYSMKLAQSLSMRYIIIEHYQQLLVCFSDDCTSYDQIKGFFEACFRAKCYEQNILLPGDNNNNSNNIFNDIITQHFELFIKILNENNWDFDRILLRPQHARAYSLI